MRMETVSWHGKSSMIPPFVVCFVSISLARRGRERRGKVKLWWAFHDENGDGQIIRWHGKSSMIPPFVVCLVSISLARRGNVKPRWAFQDVNGDGQLTWQEFNDTTFSGLPCISLAWRGRERKGNMKPWWAFHDENGDGQLTWQEFSDTTFSGLPSIISLAQRGRARRECETTMGVPRCEWRRSADMARVQWYHL